MVSGIGFGNLRERLGEEMRIRIEQEFMEVVRSDCLKGAEVFFNFVVDDKRGSFNDGVGDGVIEMRHKNC